jgi:hypothetical protein
VGIVHDLGKIRGNEMLVASRMALEMGELKEQGYASPGGIRTGVFSRQGEGTLGRECHVFLHISSIVALTWSIIKLRQESLAGIQC